MDDSQTYGDMFKYPGQEVLNFDAPTESQFNQFIVGNIGDSNMSTQIDDDSQTCSFPCRGLESSVFQPSTPPPVPSEDYIPHSPLSQKHLLCSSPTSRLLSGIEKAPLDDTHIVKDTQEDSQEYGSPVSEVDVPVIQETQLTSPLDKPPFELNDYILKSDQEEDSQEYIPVSIIDVTPIPETQLSTSSFSPCEQITSGKRVISTISETQFTHHSPPKKRLLMTGIRNIFNPSSFAKISHVLVR